MNLLSPRGSHAQGDLFYKAFLQCVLTKEKDKKFHQFERLEVTDEKHAGEGLGFIDIWIRNHAHLGRYCIIIENKIYAEDQEKQLQRYYEYAKQLGFTKENIRLFYLTLRPTRSADGYTISPTLRKELEEDHVLRYISYQEDILPWLRGVMNEVESAKVKMIIQQYMSTIYSLF